MGEIPSWVTLCERAVDELHLPSTEANIERGSYAIYALSKGKDEGLLGGNASILDIGIGFNATNIVCPYEPYRIAAYCESVGLSYDMTLVDVNPHIIADIRERRRIFSQNFDARRTAAWAEYLYHTVQEDNVVSGPEPDLIFDHWVSDQEALKFLEKGIHVANIPLSFQDKLERQAIELLEADVTTIFPSALRYAPFDLILLINVLSYIPDTQKQQETLRLLGMALSSDGQLVMGAFKTIYPWMSFVFVGRYGGWLTEESLGPIGLTLSEKISFSDSYEVWVLKRQE